MFANCTKIALRVALFFLLVAGPGGLSVVPPADAQGLSDRRPRGRGESAGGYSLDAAVEMAENRFRAKAVKAETVDDHGRRTYHIRLLNAEGRVWTVRVDAETGRMQ